MSKTSGAGATWDEVRIAPLPRMTPAYRLPAMSSGRIWVAHYDPDDWTIRPIDERWVVDTSSVLLASPARRLPVERGDLVVWVSQAVDEDGTYATAWPPSLVVDTPNSPGEGRHITTVRDGWLTDVELRDIRSARPALGKVLARARRTGIAAGDRGLLDVWGVNAFCPECGSLGAPIEWGMMPAPEFGCRGARGQLLPWPQGDAVMGGCVIPPEPSSYACHRCSGSWGQWPLADTWERHPSLGPEARWANSVELLSALGCEDVTTFIQAVEEEVEPFDLDMRVHEVGAEGCIGGTAIFQVDLPLTVEEFWVVIRDAEGYARCRMAATTLADEIEATEGFTLVMNTYGYEEGNWPTSGPPELPAYPHEVPAPDAWTLAKWTKERLAPLLADVEMSVEPIVADANGSPVAPQTRLSTLRAMSESGELWNGDIL